MGTGSSSSPAGFGGGWSTRGDYGVESPPAEPSGPGGSMARWMAAKASKVYDNILEAIGWTPLVRLNRVTRGIRTPVYAKAESLNPGGSVKDRIGIAIIEAAERSGALKPGRHHRGGHQRQHRGGPRPRRRHQGLPLHLHHPGQDVGGEGAPAARAGRGGDRRAHRGAARPSRVLHQQGPQHRGQPRRARSWPTSTTTPPTPRRTTRPRGRRSGSRRRAGSRTSSARRAPAAPSPAPGAT